MFYHFMLIVAFAACLVHVQGLRTKELAAMILQSSSSSLGGVVETAVSDSNIYFTKWNWYHAEDGSAMTIYGGAYFKTKFTGNTFGFKLDQSGAWSSGPYINLEYNIDGTAYRIIISNGQNDGTFIHPGKLGSGTHCVTVTVVSTNSPVVPRWNPPQLFIRFVSIITESGSSLSPPELKSTTMLFYGDSSGEGMEVNSRNPEITSKNQDPWPLYLDDATKSYAHFVAEQTGSEISFAALDGEGYTLGNLDVPNFINPEDPSSETWDYYFAGQSRLNGNGEYSDGSPNYIVIAIGEVDSSPYKSDHEKVHKRALKALELISKAGPSSQIFVVIPFGQFCADILKSVYAEFEKSSDPQRRVFLIDQGADAAVGLTGKTRHPWAERAEQLGRDLGQRIANAASR